MFAAACILRTSLASLEEMFAGPKRLWIYWGSARQELLTAMPCHGCRRWPPHMQPYRQSATQTIHTTLSITLSVADDALPVWYANRSPHFPQLRAI